MLEISKELTHPLPPLLLPPCTHTRARARAHFHLTSLHFTSRRYGEDANELKDAAREDYVKLFNTFMRSLAAAGEKLDKIAATEAKAKATAEAKAAKAAKKKARGNVAATSASSDLEGAGAFDRFAEFEKLSPEEQLERMKEERKAKGKKKKKKKKNMGGGHGAMQAQLAAMMAAKAAK